MNVTKETFFSFLKENDFYEGWMEGYDLDNRIYDDEVPLDDFFDNQLAHLWLYLGIGCLAFGNVEVDSSLKERWDEWREKYLSVCIDLDDKWMRFVEGN